MVDYADLIEQAKVGSEADRELDLAVGMLWPEPRPFSASIKQQRGGQPPVFPFTTSLDAVLALTEAVLPGWGHQVGRPLQQYGATGWYASVFRERKEGEVGFMPGHFSHEGHCIKPPDVAWVGRRYEPSPARALLLATLHALASEPERG